MIESATDDISKTKKKVTQSNKNGRREAHLNSPKNSLAFRLFQVLFFLAGIVLALIILEIALRITQKRAYTLDPCTSLSSDFHHVLIPSSECRFKTEEWDVLNKFNSYGQRDDEITLEKPTNVFRMLALGDSFTMGHGVDIDDSFINILERKLNDSQRTKKVDIINSGVSGYSPLVEYLYLYKKGLAFKPDMVLLFFTLTDFWDDRRRFAELKISYPAVSDHELSEKIAKGDVEFKFDLINTSGENVTQTEVLPGISDELKQWLRKRSKVYSAFADLVKKRNKVVQQDAVYQGDIDRDIVALVRGNKLKDSDWEALWKLPVENLSLISKLLEENGISFVVVIIPDAFQVSDREWPNRTALGLDEHFKDPRGPFQNELMKRLTSEKIEFIDLLTYFRSSNVFPLYFSQDGHFRESGHALTAEIIYEKIKDDVKK